LSHSTKGQRWPEAHNVLQCRKVPGKALSEQRGNALAVLAEMLLVKMPITLRFGSASSS
jgi:hypothetical protein